MSRTTDCSSSAKEQSRLLSCALSGVGSQNWLTCLHKGKMSQVKTKVRILKMLMRTVRMHKGSGVEVSSAFRVGRKNRDFLLTWTGLSRSHGFSRHLFNVWALFWSVTAHGQQNKWAFYPLDYRTGSNWWQHRTWHSKSIVPSLRQCSSERHWAPECSRKHCSRLATNFRLPSVPSSYSRADGWIAQLLAIRGQLQVKVLSGATALVRSRPECGQAALCLNAASTSTITGSKCGEVLAPLWTLGLWTSYGERWRILSQSETADGLVFRGGRRGYCQPCAQSPGSTMCAGGGRAPSFKPVQPGRATNPYRSSLSATSLKFSICLSGALHTVCDVVGHLRELLMDHHQRVNNSFSGLNLSLAAQSGSWMPKLTMRSINGSPSSHPPLGHSSASHCLPRHTLSDLRKSTAQTATDLEVRAHRATSSYRNSEKRDRTLRCRRSTRLCTLVSVAHRPHRIAHEISASPGWHGELKRCTNCFSNFPELTRQSLGHLPPTWRAFFNSASSAVGLP